MNSIALIEFSSMAEGIGLTHRLLKQTHIVVHKQEIMCPGKYVLMVLGTSQTMDYVVAELKSAKTIIGQTLIYKLHPNLMAALNRPVAYEVGGNYMVIETKNFVESISLGDAILKHTNLKLERLVDRLGLFGKGLLICSGPSAALQLGRSIAEGKDYGDKLVSVEILEAVTHNVFTF